MKKTFTFITVLLLVGYTTRSNSNPQEEMSKILDQYLSIHDLLANDSLDGISQHAKEILSLSAKLTDVKLGASLKEAAKALQSSESIKTARTNLKKLSSPLVSWAKSATPPGIDIVYCSMASARWLQKHGAIRNPYYGKSMLSCGQVEK